MDRQQMIEALMSYRLTTRRDEVPVVIEDNGIAIL